MKKSILFFFLFSIFNIGCKKEVANSSHHVYIANSFTPNEDGINDSFGPVVADYLDVIDYTMLIFSRNSEIFRTKNIDLKWNGKGKDGFLCKMGIYTYRINIKYSDNTEDNITGSVTMIK